MFDRVSEKVKTCRICRYLSFFFFNGIPLSPKDKTSLHMKCIIVCSYRPEDGHTDDRNM
jgi:hypothetical protein